LSSTGFPFSLRKQPRRAESQQKRKHSPVWPARRVPGTSYSHGLSVREKEEERKRTGRRERRAVEEGERERWEDVDHEGRREFKGKKRLRGEREVYEEEKSVKLVLL